MKGIDLQPLAQKVQSFTKLAHPKKAILVRSCESQGNLAGTITGWMNVELTDFGRKQAFHLSSVLAEIEYITAHSSDLRRCSASAFYGLAFADEAKINESRQLREINFGMHEGLHFDNLPDSDKDKFADPNFQAEGGESWSMVRERAQVYFQQIQKMEKGENLGQHIVFTHGGLITSYLNQHGVSEMPSNGSVFGVTIKDDGSCEDLAFQWDFPYLEEDL